MKQPSGDDHRPTPKHDWDTDKVIGHAPYCTSPFHSMAVYCSASPDDPPTLNGQPSRAWHADHPQQQAANSR